MAQGLANGFKAAGTFYESLDAALKTTRKEDRLRGNQEKHVFPSARVSFLLPRGALEKRGAWFLQKVGDEVFPGKAEPSKGLLLLLLTQEAPHR